MSFLALPRLTVANASYPVGGPTRAVASVVLREDGLLLVSVTTCIGWLSREEQLLRSNLEEARALADRLAGRMLGASVVGAWRDGPMQAPPPVSEGRRVARQ